MIPKIIHLCWLSGDTYPKLINKCIESWKKILPDYQVMLWDTQRFDIDSCQWVRQAFENQKYAFAADYIRLYALYHYGGIYMDADVEMLKSFDDLLQNKSFLGYETGGDLEPAIMGAIKGVEWMSKCLVYYENRSFIKDNGVFDTRPLPMVVGEVLRSYKDFPQSEVVMPTQIINGDLKLYPSYYFSPKNIHTKKVEFNKNTYSIHHFDGQWVEKGVVYIVKQFIHKGLIIVFGQKRHNKIIKYWRK